MRPHPLDDNATTPWNAANEAAHLPATLDERLVFGYDPDADGSYYPDPEDYPSVLDEPPTTAARDSTTRPSNAATPSSDAAHPPAYHRQGEPITSPQPAEPTPTEAPRNRGYLVTLTTILLGLAAVVIIAFAATMTPPSQAPAPTAPDAPAAGNQDAANPPATQENQNTEPEPTDTAADPTTAPTATGQDPSTADRRAADDDREDDDDTGQDDDGQDDD